MSSDPRQRQELAQKILHYSRRRITHVAPIMLVPIYALREKVSPIPGPLATDGVHLWYDPERVIQDFQADQNSVARQVLHVTLHCLLGHLRLRPGQEHPALFDAVADWKTSQFIQSLDHTLGLSYFFHRCYGDYPLPAMLQQLNRDQEEAKSLLKEAGRWELTEDDHTRWNPPSMVCRRGTGGDGPGESAAGESQDEAQGGGSGEPSGPNWEEMLRNMTQQAKQNGWGSIAGMLEESLTPTEGNEISYAQFLRRFAAPQERMLLDPDSFDPRWYYLGLDLYGDIPLLEPSELSEPPAPDDIVLALDTSGSCSGEVCRRFLRETLSLLRDISAGAASFRVLALQCDTRIQKELLLESADQLDGFLEDFTPRGFGGTDFRPVFQRVEQLRQEGVMPRVKGLLYLSDGYGNFPDEAPDYPVTFLLLEGGGLDLPDWVTALTLNQNDFTLKEASV